MPLSWPISLVFVHRTNLVHHQRQLADLPGEHFPDRSLGELPSLLICRCYFFGNWLGMKLGISHPVIETPVATSRSWFAMQRFGGRTTCTRRPSSNLLILQPARTKPCAPI